MQIGALEVWKQLAAPACAALVERACAADAGDVRAVQNVRAVAGDIELARVALMLGQARRKLREKFGDRAARMWADPQGAEMASSAIAAAHKARRLREAGIERVADLCCGIGADAMALVGAGLTVEAVDLEPVRTWMAGMNAGEGCAARTGDAAEVECSGAFVHIDPARRHTESGAVRRAWTLGDLSPPAGVVRAVIERAGAGGAVKLGPGVDHAEVRRELPPGEIEFISERGRLTQAVLWIGERVGAIAGTTRATLLGGQLGAGTDGSAIAEIVGVPDEHAAPCAEDARTGKFVHEPDDAVERARLQHVLCERLGVRLLHPALGVMTGETPVVSAWVRSYRVIQQIGWNLQRVREALNSLGAGVVEVKTRGGAVDTDVVQRQLRSDGGRTLVVFVYRVERAMTAIIAERV